MMKFANLLNSASTKEELLKTLKEIHKFLVSNLSEFSNDNNKALAIFQVEKTIKSESLGTRNKTKIDNSFDLINQMEKELFDKGIEFNDSLLKIERSHRVDQIQKAGIKAFRSDTELIEQFNNKSLFSYEKNGEKEYAIHSILKNEDGFVLEHGSYFDNFEKAIKYFNIVSAKDNEFRLAETGSAYKIEKSWNGKLELYSQILNNEDDFTQKDKWEKLDLDELTELECTVANKKFGTNFKPLVGIEEMKEVCCNYTYENEMGIAYGFSTYDDVVKHYNSISNEDLEYQYKRIINIKPNTFNFDNIDKDMIIQRYKESSYGQVNDYENRVGWEFASPNYKYGLHDEYSISYDQEPHIFWGVVYDDIKNGIFKEENLTINVSAGILNNDNIPMESNYANTIRIISNPDYKELRDLIIPSHVVEEYNKTKNNSEQSHLETIPDTSHLDTNSHKSNSHKLR